MTGIGFTVRPSAFERGTMACTGIEFCKLAFVETKGRADWLRQEMERRLPGFDTPITINVNGCPNSCARFQVADIGFKGMVVKDGDGHDQDAFQVHLGGQMGTEAEFGRKFRGLKVTAAEAPDYVERVLRGYQERRQDGESVRGLRHPGGRAVAALTATRRLQDVAERAGRDLEGASALEILGWAETTFGDSWAVTSSMADAVVPDLAARVRPGVDVIFLDTGYHFAETLGTRDAMASTLPVTVRTVTPAQSVAEQDASFGRQLHRRNPDQCCALRKVLPLRSALRGYSAWASGLRRDESPTRRHVPVVEWDARRSIVKLNPIASWAQQDVDRYIADNGVLVNPLLSDGYGSVGCAPCTRRLEHGEDARAGRWAGSGKTECGLH